MGTELVKLFDALRAVEQLSLKVRRPDFVPARFLQAASALCGEASTLELATAGRLAQMLESMRGLHEDPRGRLPLEAAVAFATDARSRFTPGEGEDLVAAKERLAALIAGQAAAAGARRIVQARPTSHLDVSGGAAARRRGLMTRLGELIERATGAAPRPTRAHAVPSSQPIDPALRPYVDSAGMLAVTTDPRSELRLEKPIGSGNFGVVFLATDTGFDRPVAVKVIRLPSDPGYARLMLEGIEREFRIQGGSMEGAERVVRVYQRGVTAGGQPYVAMEFIPDGSVRDVLNRVYDEQRLPTLDETQHWMAEAAAALWEAHQRAVVHRDFKPDNLFLRRHDGRSVVKLADFGGARTLQEIAEEVTQSGDGTMEIIIGTPGYMPPLTLQGQAPTLNDDVFAWGAFAYELLTSLVPWDGPDPAAILKEMLDRPHPTPPSEVRPGAGISATLDRIVLRALQFRQSPDDPVEIYADAGELLSDLLLVEPEQLREEAVALVAKTQGLTDSERRSHVDAWFQKMARAIQRAHAAYAQFQTPGIRRWIVEAQALIHQAADRGIPTLGYLGGDERQIEMAAAAIRNLDPTGPRVEDVTRQAVFEVFLDRPDRTILADTAPHFSVLRYRNEADTLRFDRLVPELEYVPEHPDQPFRLRVPRGAYALRMRDYGGTLRAVQIPLPPWPGNYGPLRIPAVLVEDLPERLQERVVIIPAGYARVRHAKGTRTERVLTWRRTETDIAMAPPITQRDWLDFLHTLWDQSAGALTSEQLPSWAPRNWHRRISGRITQRREFRPDQLIDSRNRPIDPDAPVHHITRGRLEKYFETMVPGARPPTPHERRRALFGNDTRLWPHGDGDPLPGMYDFKFPLRPAELAQLLGHSGPSTAPPPRYVGPPSVGDLSPFTPVDDQGRPIVALHTVAGQTYLFDDDPALFMPVLGFRPDESAQVALFAGGPPDSGTPDLEILRGKHAADSAASGLIGSLQVFPLWEAAPTPDIPRILGLRR